MINFSELLWRPQSRGERRPSAHIEVPRGDYEPALDRVPVTDVTITPEMRIASFSDAGSVAADRFRLLRMRLKELRAAAKVRTILISSPIPEDGKTTIALNLATLLAEGGKRRVLLLEADLHRPSIAKALNIPTRAGLAECLEAGSDPSSMLEKISKLDFYLLQAGKAETTPGELLESETLGEVFARLQPLFEWIVIDTPPVGIITDAVALSRHADTSLLVVRAHRTPRAAIEDSLAMMGKHHVLGIVVNGEEGLNESYSRYGSYHPKR